MVRLAIVTLVSVSAGCDSDGWQPVREGKDYTIGGMAFVESSAAGHRFLTVNDNKSKGKGRFAFVTVPASGDVKYEEVKLAEMPGDFKDIEALTKIPGTSDYLAFGGEESSEGALFRVSISSANEAKVVKVQQLVAKVNEDFEAFDLLRIEGVIVAVWGDRGGIDNAPGHIYWGTFSPSGNSLTTVGSVEWRTPWPVGKVGAPARPISDIDIDPSGTLLITAASDAGDDGPFDSAVYLGGVIQLKRGQPVFAANPAKEPSALRRFPGRKVEACEGVPGYGFWFATDDENKGSSIIGPSS